MKFVLAGLISFLLCQDLMAEGSSECDQGAQCANKTDSPGKKNGLEICKDGKRPCGNQTPDKKEGTASALDEEKAAPKPSEATQGEQIRYFKDGKIKEKFKLAGRADYEWYEAYYQNGKMRVTLKRKQKSNSPFSSDIYDYSSFSDKGLVTEKGDCAVLPIEELPKTYCSRLTGEGFSYDENGRISLKISYQDGKLHGPKVYFYYEINQEETRFYNQDRLEKVEIKDSKANKILKTEEYYEDGSIK